MSVATVIDQLVVIESGLSGVKVAHDETPETLSEFPAFINFPSSGTFTVGPGGQGVKKHLATLIAEVHLTRQILPQAEAAARPYIESFADAILADVTLGGTVDSVLEIRWTYGVLAFGAEQHLGCRFELDYKAVEVI